MSEVLRARWRTAGAVTWGVVAAVATATLLGGSGTAHGGPATVELGGSQPAAPAHGQATGSITGSATDLTLTVDRSLLPVGRVAAFRGRLTDPASGWGVPGATVRLEVLSPETGGWEPVQELVTDGGGGLAASVVAERTARYRLHHGEPGSLEESTSPELQVRVARLTAALARDAVRAGRSVAVRGVLVAHPGAVLRLERRDAGRWVTVARTRTAADQSYAFKVRPTAPGFWRWRVVRDARGEAPRSVAGLPRLDAFRLHTYSVVTRGQVAADVVAFRAAVATTYADPRGWARAHHRFREVRRGGDFTVVLARPAYLPGFAWFCSPSWSCQAGRHVVINARRWAHGSRSFTGTLETYRQYVVEHETGHWLGLGHAFCPRRGVRAPVMQQQSKGMQGCRPNGWPLPREVRAVS